MYHLTFKVYVNIYLFIIKTTLQALGISIHDDAQTQQL